uniref:Uncharacterized protein n=1 Tax=Eutreptiella gymnastica TaxID=73025 RepID=A0A7S1IRC8_9EUGL
MTATPCGACASRSTVRELFQKLFGVLELLDRLFTHFRQTLGLLGPPRLPEESLCAFQQLRCFIWVCLNGRLTLIAKQLFGSADGVHNIRLAPAELALAEKSHR